ncbi:MAG: glutamate formimidoyltransferase [Thermoanaerobaculia bacterium]
MRLLEAVPNLSEGRDGQRLGRILGAIVAEPGAHLLDVSVDVDHNRTVLTLVGEAGPLGRVLFTLYREALERLDLTRHQGVHPRFGIVDVCPWVPLAGATMLDAVEAAHRLAQRVGEELALPVYVYGAASREASRRELPDLRRLLGAAQAAGRALPPPDSGPRERHPTGGVTVIGARPPLVAFNALLDTDDVAVARAVARRIRASSGGLPGVRALGVELASRSAAQVTMNLIDIGTTPPAQALKAVREAAAGEGATVTTTEIVGLLPRSAAAGLEDPAARLEGGIESRLLEPRLIRLGLLEHGEEAMRQAVERTGGHGEHDIAGA